MTFVVENFPTNPLDVVNLGKWVLRYLFANLVDEEIKRDEAYRSNLVVSGQRANGLSRDNAPPTIQLPSPQLSRWASNQDDDDSVITPRAVNGHHLPAMTPGLSIGVATPAIPVPNHGTNMQNHLPSTAEETTSFEKQPSNVSQRGPSGDYFSSNPPSPAPQQEANVTTTASNGAQPEPPPQSPSEADKGEKTKESNSLFSKKFRMNFPKKLGRTSVEAKPIVVDEKAEESDKSSDKEDKTVEENFLGVVQKIRYDYDEQITTTVGEPIQSNLAPSLPNETPRLNPPPFATVIIQEDRPDSGGVVDLYRGTVASTGQDADLIEKAAPMWLGDLLLRVRISSIGQKYPEIN